VAKAKRNNAMVVWLYGAGYINPDADGQKLSATHISGLTGIKVGVRHETTSPKFRVTDMGHPALKYADADRIYGFIDRDIHSNVWLGSPKKPPYMNPSFFACDDDADVLGRFCENGQAALAIKQLDGWTSVYSAPHVLRSELLASLASYAGCHIYTTSDDVLYANRNFVAIHAAKTGKRTIKFPHPVSPYEVYEQKYFGENVTEIEVGMRLGQTLMFSINGK
jgi:hypothetical protein